MTFRDLDDEDRRFLDQAYREDVWLSDRDDWGEFRPTSPFAKNGRVSRPAQRALHPLDDPELVNDFLAQDVAWQMADRSRNDGWIAIADMEPSHALNTARFILRRAREIALTIAVAEGTDLSNTGGRHPHRVAAMDDVAARAWMLDTPLVRALLARAGAKPAEVARPWEAFSPQHLQQFGPAGRANHTSPHAPPQQAYEAARRADEAREILGDIRAGHRAHIVEQQGGGDGVITLAHQYPGAEPLTHSHAYEHHGPHNKQVTQFLPVDDESNETNDRPTAEEEF